MAKGFNVQGYFLNEDVTMRIEERGERTGEAHQGLLHLGDVGEVPGADLVLPLQLGVPGQHRYMLRARLPKVKTEHNSVNPIF